MIKNNLIKIFVILESILLILAFLDVMDENRSYLFELLNTNAHNAMVTNLFFATFILFFYGFWRIIKHGQWKDPVNYLAIFSSCLYLYLMYVEVVVEKAF